jgi:hypothetical protein
LVVRQRGVIFVHIGDGYWQRFNWEALEDAAIELVLDEGIALARWARG